MVDREAVWEFIERFTELAAGATTMGLLAVGERSGLLDAMADGSARTPSEVAAEADLDQRYVEEILAGLAASGIVEYDPEPETFRLPEEHAVCLVDDSSPYFMGGWLAVVPALFDVVPEVAVATRVGGGVPFERFGEEMVEGIDRSNSPSLRILLTRKWLPTMPDVVARLEAGGRVADVGCGSGTAVLAMAAAFPASTVMGFDIDARSISRARAKAEKAEIENASFSQLGAAEIPTAPPFHLITSFDVVHDIAQPLDALRHLREALADDGTYLMMEPNVDPELENNLHPRGALLYGISALHCMTQSLARGGAGLGAAWGPHQAEALCREAGFGHFRRLEIENPFSAFYEVKH